MTSTSPATASPVVVDREDAVESGFSARILGLLLLSASAAEGLAGADGMLRGTDAGGGASFAGASSTALITTFPGDSDSAN